MEPTSQINGDFGLAAASLDDLRTTFFSPPGSGEPDAWDSLPVMDFRYYDDSRTVAAFLRETSRLYLLSLADDVAFPDRPLTSDGHWKPAARAILQDAPRTSVTMFAGVDGYDLDEIDVPGELVARSHESILRNGAGFIVGEGALPVGEAPPGLNFVFGEPSPFATFQITGSEFPESIDLGAFDDLAQGGGGKDRIRGFDGADLLSGNNGNDLILAGNGDDTASGGRGRDVEKGGPGNDLLIGNGGADILIGQRGDDTLQGGPGDDTLNAGDGRDVVEAGAGDDTVVVDGRGKDEIRTGPGDDTVVIEGASRTRLQTQGGDDVVRIETRGTQTATANKIDTGAGDDLVTLTGDFNVVRTGADADTIDAALAGDGSRVLSGDGDDDIDVGGMRTYVHAGPGRDLINLHLSAQDATLNGGPGADIFVLKPVDPDVLPPGPSTVATIEGFQQVTDTIDFRELEGSGLGGRLFATSDMAYDYILSDDVTGFDEIPDDIGRDVEIRILLDLTGE